MRKKQRGFASGSVSAFRQLGYCWMWRQKSVCWRSTSCSCCRCVVTLDAKPLTITTDLPGRTSAYRIAEVRPQVGGIILKTQLHRR